MTTYETLLSKTEMEALRRFAECCEDSDSGGHDVPKMMMKRLASAGAVVCTSTRWGIYETTKFGNLLLDMHRDVIAPVPTDDAWWRGEEDADGNLLTTIRVDELSALRDQPDALSALRELVELKDMKNQHGEVPEYCRRQPVAWDRAREILARGPGTFACPICGKDSLHQHTGEEIAKHRGAAAPEPIHASDAPTDDAYVMDFAEVMKAKMARSREKGRDDWQDCSPDDLSRMLRDHVEKGDPVDVANFCMMLYHLGKPIATRPAPAVDAVPVHAATVTRFGVLHSTFEEPGFEKVPDAGKLYYLPAATKGEA